MYLISKFYANCENRENLMLTKYTCFTVTTNISLQVLESALGPTTKQSVCKNAMHMFVGMMTEHLSVAFMHKIMTF